MQKKLDLMKTPEGESFLPILKTLTKNRIYSNEHRGAHLILGSQRGSLFKGGAHSREALIKYIKKTSKYFQLVYLIKQ